MSNAKPATKYVLRIRDAKGELALLDYQTVKPTPDAIDAKIKQYKGDEGVLEWTEDGTWRDRSIQPYRSR